MAVTSFRTSSMTTGLKRARVWDQSSSPGNFESIATSIVGSTAVSEIIFSSIPQTYTHLQVRAIAITSTADRSLKVQFNSDTSTNYSAHDLEGTGAGTAYSSGFSSIAYGLIGTTPNSTTYPCAFVCDILDYANTNKYKTTKSLVAADNNNSIGGYSKIFSSNWRSTSAIVSIRLTPSSGNFSQYSHFALYGVL